MSDKTEENGDQTGMNVPARLDNVTHIRTDSAFSMDSFVFDPKLAVTEDSEDLEADGKVGPQENREEANAISNPSPDASSVIHRRSGSRVSSGGQSSSDSGIPPPSPVHNFFKAYAGNESDDVPSDGSIVFNHTLPAAVPSLARKDRARFPSFDSVGSSGSLVRKAAPPRTANKSVPKTPPPAPAQPKPKILPYHERKRMQQRQAQEQQKPPAPPPRPPASSPSQQPPFVMPPNQPFPPPPHSPRMYPPYPPPNAYAMPPPHGYAFPPPPGMLPNTMPIYPPPHGAYPSMPMPPVDPRQQQYTIPSYGELPPPTSSGGSNKAAAPRTRQQQQQTLAPPPPPPGQYAARPPMQPQQSVPAYQFGGGKSGVSELSWTGSSSFDSSEAEQPPGSSGAAPPPPPPPPPPPQAPPSMHIREDSSGSVSSLGSQERGSGLEPDQQPPSATQETDSRSFFERISPWKTTATEEKHTINDFHRTNQAFLSRIERQSSSSSLSSPRRWPGGSPGPVLTRRVPLTSMDRPPPSRGGHRRLNSIENDDWTESADEDDPLLSKESEEEKEHSSGRSRVRPGGTKETSWRRGNYGATGGGDESSSNISSSEASDDSYRYDAADEKGRRLPPSGISTNEYYDQRYQDSLRTTSSPYGSTSGSSSNYFRQSPESAESPNYFRPSPESAESRDGTSATLRIDNTTYASWFDHEREQSDRLRKKQKKKKKKKKKKRRSSRKSRRAAEESESSSSSESSTSGSSRDPWIKRKASYLEEEKARIIEKWKKEAKEEAERNRWDRRLWRYFESTAGHLAATLFVWFAWTESFFGNLPLTIGAIALASANLGVDWFKFAEENLSSCEPVHFHSAQCSFPEFPGCFYCDTSNRLYQVAVNFHFVCSCFAGLLAFSFIAKFILARRVVLDALSSPTTATPAGLLCMTLNVVFAGRGVVGMVVVSVVSCVHLCLAIWFMYMALAYHIMPEPSWFPNTTGIGISAVKVWLYHPMAGHFLMAISLTLNFFFFPISFIRVFLNRKISAPVGWMQMSAPNVSLYALTIMAQPSFQEENPDVNSFQVLHRKVYLPCMHFLFSLCILGMIASVSSLIVRWDEFKKQPFSPAHSAFLCPTLSHANAVQAYRGALIAFSSLHHHSPPLVALYTYWVTVLVGGTIAYLCIATRFLMCLPEWTHFDLEGDIEPPAPYETAMTLSNMVQSGETLFQPFVSPAVLQANETGTLVLTRDAQGRQKYVRTRRVTALGFEPIMDVIKMEHEREILLDWVARNKPRRRNRTLSVPGIDFNYGASGIGSGSGVYGMQEDRSPLRRMARPRSHTLSPRVTPRDAPDSV